MLSILVKYQWIQPTSQSLPLQSGWWFDFQTSLVLINSCLFWSLHTEISLLIISAQGMEGSGLDEIMSKCGLSTVRADSLVTVNDLKRAVYCLQAGASVIYSKLMQAYIDNWFFVVCQQKQDEWNVFLLETDPRTYNRIACLHKVSSRGQISTIYCITLWWQQLCWYNLQMLIKTEGIWLKII